MLFGWKLIGSCPGFSLKFLKMKPTIRIDVVSDVVCPWCYIGKRRLEKAIDSLNHQYDFDVHYHPFELNPTIPAQGLNQKEYLSNKFGGESRYNQITQHVTSVAASEGLEFNFSKQGVSPNTRLAHRIIHLAEDAGVQKAAVEALFKAYFTDGLDLSNKENLIAVATQAGLNKDAVMELLKSDDREAEVIAAEQEMQRHGITGVPFYIINSKYGVSGAQPSTTFVEAFKQIGREFAASAAESCNVEEGSC
jgi:predicted DsbA family dithiol-disulfide isomerase